MTLAFRLKMARLRVLFLTEAAGVVVIAPVVVVVVVVGIVIIMMVVVVMAAVVMAAVAVAAVSPVSPVPTAVPPMTAMPAAVAKCDVLSRLNAGDHSDHRAAQQCKETPSLHHRVSSVGSTRRTGQEPV
jgi:hypothetical protein